MRIACMPPYEELADKLATACRELGIEAEIMLTPELPQAVETARQLAECGIQVIVARGIAAWRVRMAEAGLSVVDIPVTGFDMLTALQKAEKLGGPIGICELAPIIRTAESMEQYTKIPLIKHVIEDYTNLETGISLLRQQGAQVIIGRRTAVDLALRLNMAAVPIFSSSESVFLALEEAQRVVLANKIERARAEQFRAILDFAYGGIVAIDARGRLSFFNPVAEKITGLQKDLAIGQPANKLVPDMRLPEVLNSGKTILEEIQEIKGNKIITTRIPIIVDGNIQGVVATFQEVGQLQHMEQNVRRKLNPCGHLAYYTFNNLIGRGKAIADCINKARNFAMVDSTVLIVGETGTGKEIFAHAIHNESPRRRQPFVAVNCAALPENLLESELFGYVEGAFTGARKSGKPGLFELAHLGTIFMDEITEMSYNLQSKLLRVLEQHEVTRLGDDKLIPVDVRVIASSNRKMSELIKDQSFRQDLYHRLNVLRLELPPLRNRKEDIPAMASAFLDDFCQHHHKQPALFSREALELMCAWDWPGNVRELKNTVERISVLNKDRIISAGSIQTVIDQPISLTTGVTGESATDQHQALDEWEKEAILRALSQAGGNKTRAAGLLGIARTTLWRKLKTMEGC